LVTEPFGIQPISGSSYRVSGNLNPPVPNPNVHTNFNNSYVSAAAENNFSAGDGYQM
jgi:hypothetical protein